MINFFLKFKKLDMVVKLEIQIVNSHNFMILSLSTIQIIVNIEHEVKS